MHQFKHNILAITMTEDIPALRIDFLACQLPRPALSHHGLQNSLSRY